jgi:serine/threonine protein kinase
VNRRITREEPGEIDTGSPPFDSLRSVRPLATNRSGRDSAAHARHQLYVGRDIATAAQMLVKVTTRPGLVYERNLTNEIDILTTVNRELPASRTFPVMEGHGRLPDGRLYLMTYLFDELALAASIDSERMPSRVVGHLRTAIAAARAVMDLHGIPIIHVDLNPMNILHRVEQGRPVIRIVDFESAYDPARHGSDVFYDPPTTAGYSAPEIPREAPDARSDVFSLGAVLYTMLSGFDWTWHGEAAARVEADRDLDPALRAILLSAVAPDRERRYASAAAFHDALSSHLENIWPGRSW